jgi:hypothetical protein
VSSISVVLFRSSLSLLQARTAFLRSSQRTGRPGGVKAASVVMKSTGVISKLI